MIEYINELSKCSIYHVYCDIYIKNILKMIDHRAFSQAVGCDEMTQ